MKVNDHIRLIEHSKIDYALYDRSVEKASNCLVYACSWYLDAIAGKWNVLVMGDYDFVMPLPCRRKWGIRYVFLPPFLQQLGIFPPPPVEIEIAFYRILTAHFLYVDYATAGLPVMNNIQGFAFTKKHTRTLLLDNDYTTLAGRFGENLRRNLKISVRYRIAVTKQNNGNDFFRLQRLSKKIPVPEGYWRRLQKLVEITLLKGLGFLYTAQEMSEAGNISSDDPNAAVFFILWHGRAYYMMAVASDEGRNQRSVFAIIDCFIRDFAGTGILLDFEGSAIPGVDRFFEGFGAVKESYYAVHVNRLPFPWHLFKK